MSRLQIRIEGLEPGLIQHAWSPAPLLSKEEEDQRLRIVRKTESKRSVDEKDELERADCLRSIWVDGALRPCVPQSVFRAVLEGGARQEKSGGEIRSNVIVESTVFEFDEERLGSSPEEWGRTLRFSAGVKVGQSRLNRTRALFPAPWAVTATLDIEELEGGAPAVDADQITRWMTLAGRRIGIGDWRPQKSGVHGRFRVASVEWLDDEA